LRRYLKNKGFTFLEVLAALVILSVALIPLLTWVPTSISTKIKTESYTTAMFLCQGKMEELRFKLITNFVDESDSGGAFTPPFDDFSYSVTYDTSLHPYLKQLSVEVWHNDSPEDETVLDTYIAQRW